MQRINKNQIKYLRSLSQTKFRKEFQHYTVEGHKCVEEWLQEKAPIEYLIATEKWLNEHSATYLYLNRSQILIATTEDLEKISHLKTVPEVMLSAKIRPTEEFIFNNEWILVLEKVQDPGNMGTIIRTADWFGIKKIVVSPDCVDIYNPKVVQSTMGALLRVSIFEKELASFLKENTAIPSYATLLEGDDIRQVTATGRGFIVMGNESKGLSSEISALAQHKIKIPGFGTTESLNVAVAAGIACFTLIAEREKI